MTYSDTQYLVKHILRRFTCIKTDTITAPQTDNPKYNLDDEVNLYELLPALSFTVPESMSIINGLNSSRY